MSEICMKNNFTSTSPTPLLQPQRSWPGSKKNFLSLWMLSSKSQVQTFVDILHIFQVQVWDVESGDHIVTFGDPTRWILVVSFKQVQLHFLYKSHFVNNLLHQAEITKTTSFYQAILAALLQWKVCLSIWKQSRSSFLYRLFLKLWNLFWKKVPCCERDCFPPASFSKGRNISSTHRLPSLHTWYSLTT